MNNYMNATNMTNAASKKAAESKILHRKEAVLHKKTYVKSCNQHCEIVDYIDCTHVICKFDDGTCVTTTMGQFNSGKIRNTTVFPWKEELQKTHTNETRKMNNGFYAKVINFIDEKRVLIEYDIPELLPKDRLKVTLYKTFQSGRTGVPEALKQRGTSKPEQFYCRYIMHQIAGNRLLTNYGKENKEFLNGLEADAYDPKAKVIVEYLGSYWHNRPETYRNDMLKRQLCLEKGYHLIRIVEFELKEEYRCENDIVVQSYRRESMEQAAKELLEQLKKYYDLEV